MDQTQPKRVFNAIVIVIQGLLRVEGRININTLYLAIEFLLQRLECQQVVPVDQYIVENIILTHPMRRMVRLLWVFDENPRLQPWPVVFPNPGEFEFRVLSQRCVPLAWLIRRRLLRIRLTLSFAYLLSYTQPFVVAISANTSSRAGAGAAVICAGRCLCSTEAKLVYEEHCR